MKIFIVIPAFNEEKNIGKVLKEVSKTKYPIIVVDDGSTDKTFKVLQKFQIPNSKFQILRHRVNLGKGAAMKTGAEAAFALGADGVVFMDSDGQHKVSDYLNLLKA